MKRLLLLLTPVLVFVLAFRPVNNVTITGKITDDKGNPIAGATVLLKGTRTGVSSNVNGTYQLAVNELKGVLVFSSVSTESVEVAINGRTVIDVVLIKSSKSMQEVVVTSAYGQKRKLATTSTTVYGYTNTRTSANLNQTLQGRVAGIQVTNANGNGYYPTTTNCYFDGER